MVKAKRNREAPPHPCLELDENSLWAFKTKPAPVFPQTQFQVPVVKFHAITRECPIHGEQVVTNRNFQPQAMNSVEGLACGHTLLIYRIAKGIRENTKFFLTDPRAWKFHHWQLCYLDTC